MSDNNTTEQITKPEENKASTPKREKDPKKVAAGKKLAEYNRRHKEAYEREMKREAEKNLESIQEEEESSTSEEGESWIPNLSFSTVVSLIGVGIAAVDLYMRYRRNRGDHFDWQPVTTVISREIPKAPPSTPITTQSNEVVPKIGMC